MTVKLIVIGKLAPGANGPAMVVVTVVPAAPVPAQLLPFAPVVVFVNSKPSGI